MKIFIASFILLFTLGACSNKYEYLSDDIVSNYNLGSEDLKRIQFYLSKDITLERKLTAGETNIREGKIVVKNGNRIEQIKIKKNTPGVLVFNPKKNRLGVSFDPQTKAFLMFSPKQKADGRFLLSAKEWDRNYGLITYNEKVYTTSSSSAYAGLLVDIDKYIQSDVRSKTAKGIRVN